MTAEELSNSAANDPAPPAAANPAAKALWYARAGKWDSAHDLCQDIPGTAGSWIHAWLHREEGDHGNAAYWYSRAGKPVPPEHLTPEQEWMAIASELVG
jgi:hypothetical protein